MWASGTFTFPSNRAIAIGDNTVESTRIVKVDYKPKKDLIFVHQEKTYTRAGEEEVLVKERRIHVFRRGVEDTNSVSSSPLAATTPSTNHDPPTPPSRPDFSFSYTPNAAHLFRFSALTFNGHKIHYDPIWTRDVEGHRGGIVVHGPLTALISIECADKWASETGQRLAEFDYRAVNPMYAGSQVTFCGRYVQGNSGKDSSELEVWAEQDGKVGMKGVATLVVK
jgi:hydroxyacyl-ACP dehydratase HTD2-like protein with hotdog domain